jgi:hypothetical protein
MVGGPNRTRPVDDPGNVLTSANPKTSTSTPASSGSPDPLDRQTSTAVPPVRSLFLGRRLCRGGRGVLSSVRPPGRRRRKIEGPADELREAEEGRGSGNHLIPLTASHRSQSDAWYRRPEHSSCHRPSTIIIATAISVRRRLRKQCCSSYIPVTHRPSACCLLARDRFLVPTCTVYPPLNTHTPHRAHGCTPTTLSYAFAAPPPPPRPATPPAFV